VTTLFDRAGFCQIGDRRFLNLHFRFKVTKSLSGEPNTAEVQVWGLSESSRAAIPDATVPVLLVAGYKDATEVVETCEQVGLSRVVARLRPAGVLKG